MSQAYSLKALRRPTKEEEESVAAFSRTLNARYGMVAGNRDRMATAFPLLFSVDRGKVDHPSCGHDLGSCPHCEGWEL